jgi:hypothetical protein
LLADSVVLVFTAHELDVVNLDAMLAELWRILRRGGSLLIQDALVPIYREIEYLCLQPEELKAILASTHANCDVRQTVAGKSEVPVYTFRACKPSSQDCHKAYGWWSFADDYAETLHRSLLKDCWEFLGFRRAVEQEREIDTTELAMLCHRITAKARAFHQMRAYTALEGGKATYCLACGSHNVTEQVQEPNVKDPGMQELTCHSCGHVYLKEISSRPWWIESMEHRMFLDQGPGLDRVASEWRLEWFKVVNANMMDTLGFLLERVPMLPKDPQPPDLCGTGGASP